MLLVCLIGAAAAAAAAAAVCAAGVAAAAAVLLPAFVAMGRRQHAAGVLDLLFAAAVVVFGSALSRLLCNIVAKRFQLLLSFSSLSLFKFAEYLELVFFC